MPQVWLSLLPERGLTTMPRYQRQIHAALTPQQAALLALAGRERVVDRLAHLMATGKIAASMAGAAYLGFLRAGCFERKGKGKTP
jgi:hypothetical protein